MQRESVNKKKTTRKSVSPPVEEEDNGVAGFLPDLLRRGLTLGFTGFFLTEEAVRKALGESVPRDLMDFILTQSERTRAEFLDRVSKEFARAFSAFEPLELVTQLLEGRSIEVSARIRLVPSSTEEDEGGRGRSKRGRSRAK
jgi:hypothetical protein